MKKVFIYGIVDPRKPNEFRIIGKTKLALSVRLNLYICPARYKKKLGRRLTASEIWILSLVEKGIRPQILLIEKCVNWKSRERRAISLYRGAGHKLLNKLAGGNGAESGSPKRFCTICSSRKLVHPGGQRYCPTCAKKAALQYKQGETIQPARRILRMARLKRYRSSAKGRANQRRYYHRHIMKWRTYHRNFQRTRCRNVD